MKFYWRSDWVAQYDLRTSYRGVIKYTSSNKLNLRNLVPVLDIHPKLQLPPIQMFKSIAWAVNNLGKQSTCERVKIFFWRIGFEEILYGPYDMVDTIFKKP